MTIAQPDSAAAPGWSTLAVTDPRAAQCLPFEQAINVELTLFRYALPASDKRCFFRSVAEAQELVDRGVKGLPAGLRARVASIHASRQDLERQTAETGGSFQYFRMWGLLVEFQKAD